MTPDRDADEVAIARILRAYTEGIDRGDFRAVAELFAHGSWNSRIGSQEAFEYLSGNMILYSGTPRTAHVLSDLVIEVADDRASARSKCTVWQQPPGEGLRPIAIMRYDDSFWKPGGQWAFRHRDGTMLLAGDLRAHLRRPPPPPIERRAPVATEP